MRRRWFPIGLTVCLCLLHPAIVSAQFDPDSPAPLAPLRGTLVLQGSAAPVTEALETLIEFGGGTAARVVMVDDADPPRDIQPNRRVARWTQLPLHRSDRPKHQLDDALGTATAVWLAVDDIDNAPPQLTRALQSVLRRGGAVGGATQIVAAPDGLDLLPGGVAMSGPDPEATRLRLRQLTLEHPALVGIDVAPAATLVLEQRRLSVTNGGTATAWVAPGAGKPWLSRKIGGSARADLIALSRAAAARQRGAFPADPAPEPRVTRGTLMLGGGGDLPTAVLKRFLNAAGGNAAPIVFIPCSSKQRLEREPAMVQILRDAGASNVSWIHTKDRGRANRDPSILDELRQARGVWLGGGRQWNFVDSYLHTEVHRLLHRVLARGGVIAGSSAGASVQADYMVRGDPLGNLNIAADGYEQGFGFLTGVAVDQHFSQRDRGSDMRELIEMYPQLLGIGLDEGVTLVVRGAVAEVIASPKERRAFFFDRVDGQLHIDRLRDGQRYDLATRKPVTNKMNP